jgi:hypothetical protein
MKMSYGFVDYAKVVAKFGEGHIAPGGRVEHLEPVADDVQKLEQTKKGEFITIKIDELLNRDTVASHTR